MTLTVVLEYWHSVVVPAVIARLKNGILTTIVSLQPGDVVHTKPYAPPAVKPVIVLLLLVGAVMTVADGLFASAVHVPVPNAAIVAVSFLQWF